MSRIQLKSADGATVIVDLRREGSERFVAGLDDRHVEGQFQELPDGGFLLRIGHRVLPGHCLRKESRVEVWLRGESYLFEQGEARSRGAHPAVGQVAEEILAPMPGTILRIHVQTGALFAAHQPLIIMESMKMEMTLSAPHAGRVRAMKCKAGELVAMGQMLAQLDVLETNAELPPPSENR